MKLAAFIILFILGSYSAHSQQSKISVMILWKEEKVINYFDSLFQLKPNQAYKIEKKFAPNGDLIFNVSFATADEEFYGCSGTAVRFMRVNGVEVCVNQNISGPEALAGPYLAYIKDNFKEIGKAKWEKPNGLLNITATFEMHKGNRDFFIIAFESSL